MSVTFDFLEERTKEILAQFDKDREKGDWGTVHCSHYLPSEQARLGIQLVATPVRVSPGEVVYCVPMASHDG